MLSDSLEALSAHFHEWARRGGVEMEPPACRAIADQLRQLAGDARMLESAQVPVGFRLPADAGANIVQVDFAGARWVRDMKRWALEGGPVRGGAA